MSIRNLSLVLLLATVACGGGDNEKSTEKTEAKAPGSDGAMCEEHGVLEAICTKCNPKLVAVFEAKGDYCEEHGFPMSVCPIHHPERGGRPVASIATDKAPPDGTKVRLKTQDTARLAGIKVVKVERRPGGERLDALATITYDATKWAQVNARAAGVVREIKVDVGASVKAGAPIAVIESATVGADRSRLKAAVSRAAIAETTYNREVELHKKGISAQKDVLAAQQELDAARAEQTAATAAVGVVGGGTSGSGYVLVAPIAGTVTKRNVTIGNMVAADERVLFEIVDTRVMRAEIEIPEAELRRVHAGQDVVIAIDTLPGTELAGKLDYLAPDVARETRTTKARVTLANPDGVLRANMFGRARIALGDAAESLVVPRIAVQRVGEVNFAFVRLAEGEYEARRVKTGSREGDHVEITQGIKAGELVVTEGSFLLKTETLKGSIGAGCCE